MITERRRWTRESPDVRRQQLLDAARQLIIERGYDATAMSDVAEAAGVGKGTVYLYFDSKLELLEGLQALFWERMMTVAKDAIDRRSRTWRGRWRHLLEDLVDYGVSEDELFHALFVASPGTDIGTPDVLTEMISELILRQQEAGAARLVDVETTSRFIVGAFRGMGSWLVHSTPTERRARVAHMLEIIDRTIGGTEAA